ncbi:MULTISPECIES: mobile mystery protein A [unclassified Mesorhizobium]|uniref:mobile mystery protein A n=1 Tax=unclassified Mesorhizobium TaxID=325217 RepID=UPI000959CF3B|nr:MULTISPECIES: mobile mystery protein A [unclassified Mesorhizobium]MBN9253267.1 mobile mystery protein A [Mesorhizobium sp.]OJX82266.1 MAG: transcriptional regulator [Mesorhizobium sp. 65-26]
MRKLNDRALRRLDERLSSAKPVERLTPPPKGWIRAIRDGLGMSGAQLGKRMGVAQQTIQAFELSEESGAIQLQTLRRVAEALGGKLVYAIVPDSSLEAMIRDRAREVALRALARVSHTMRLEDQATGVSDLEARIDDYIRDELRDRDLWSDG